VNSGATNKLASDVRETLRLARADRPIEPEIRLLIDRVRSVRSRKRQQMWAGFGAGLAAAAAIILLLVLPLTRKVQFTVGNGQDSGVENRWIHAEAELPVPLRFSDGTAMDLSPGTRARVAALSRHGASLSLETGRISANVVHRNFADWTIGAGPYLVRVVGTEFDVAWDPDLENLEVEVRRGTVKVSGPVLADDQSVSTEQRLTVSLRERRATIHTLDSEASLTDVPPAEMPSAEGADLRGPENARSASPGDLSAQWITLYRQGDYDKALELVDRLGFDSVARASGPDDLMKLYDLVRIAKQPTRAIRVLLIARRRFPTSEAASIAAYKLGTTYAEKGQHAEAARWFVQYLREPGSRKLAPEALGRLMESQERLGWHERAEATAHKYLSVYPNGPHRDYAQRLTSH